MSIVIFNYFHIFFFLTVYRIFNFWILPGRLLEKNKTHGGAILAAYGLFKKRYLDMAKTLCGA
jgi:hypothetical protein